VVKRLIGRVMPVCHASHRVPSIVETAVIKQSLIRLRMRWQQQTDHRSGETELRPAASGYCRALLPGIEGLDEHDDELAAVES